MDPVRRAARNDLRAEDKGQTHFCSQCVALTPERDALRAQLDEALRLLQDVDAGIGVDPSAFLARVQENEQ